MMKYGAIDRCDLLTIGDERINWLQRAARNGNTKMVELLLKHFKYDRKELTRASYLATQKEHYKIGNMLLDLSCS